MAKNQFWLPIKWSSPMRPAFLGFKKYKFSSCGYSESKRRGGQKARVKKWLKRPCRPQV